MRGYIFSIRGLTDAVEGGSGVTASICNKHHIANTVIQNSSSTSIGISKTSIASTARSTPNARDGCDCSTADMGALPRH
jgi:hypothetical protein